MSTPKLVELTDPKRHDKEILARLVSAIEDDCSNGEVSDYDGFETWMECFDLRSSQEGESIREDYRGTAEQFDDLYSEAIERVSKQYECNP